MKLLSLYVENFGTLQGFSLSPADGFNVLYQKNGWGKTTLAVFIKAMLYGLPASTKRTLDDNERKKYTPWQGGAFGGCIEFETAKGRFRAERFFGAKESLDTFALYDLDTNLPSTVYSASLGEELFGIDADGFERSTYLSQRILSGGRNNSSIAAKLGDLLDDVDDVSSFDAAMAALDKRRKFYSMTGNRGAIADTEADLLQCQNRLLHCQAVEDTLRLREQELASANAALKQATEQTAALRQALQKAGLAREHAALNEQKQRMLSELAALTRKHEQINDFFQNAPPTNAELAEGKRLYEQIKDAKARLDALPAQFPERQTLDLLRRRFSGGAPNAETCQRIEADNQALVDLCAKQAALKDREQDAILARFPDGAPSNADLTEAKNDLREANKLQAALEDMRAQRHALQRAKGRTLLCLLLLLVGGALAILSCLPALGAALPLLISGGILCLASAAGLAVLGNRRKKTARELQAAEARLAQDRAKKLASVRELLEVCGCSAASDGELVQALADLSVLCEHYRAARQRAKEASHVQGQRAEQIERLAKRLYSVFSVVYENVPYKHNYLPEIHAMYRDIDLLARLEQMEGRYRRERLHAEAQFEACKQELLPFLRRFDPAGKMRAGECLAHIAERLSEFTRLAEEIGQKKEALQKFVADKQLDSIDRQPIDETAYDRIVSEEKTLAEQIAVLQSKRTRLLSEIEHLSNETEQIPDLIQKEERLKTKLAEYRAGLATVTTAAKLLEEAKNALSTRYLGGMQASFSRFLSKLVQDQAPESVLDTSFEVRLREGGQTRQMDCFSQGWRDAVDFCMRLSLTEALFENGEKPFLMLDDPFVNLDDERLPAAKALLEELSQTYQILYFVCHKDRI